MTVKRVSAAQPSVSTSTLLTEDFKAEEPLSDLKVTEVGANSLRLSWQAPERAFNSFIIELNSTSNTSKDSIIKVSGEARHAHVEGLNADMNYEITLYGRKAGEKSQPISVFVKTGTWTFVLESTVVCHNANIHNTTAAIRFFIH